MARTDLPRTSSRVELPPALALLVERGLALLEERRTDLSNLASIVEVASAERLMPLAAVSLEFVA